MMLFNLLIRRAEQPARADKSAVCAINRHLRMVGVVRQCGLLPRFVSLVTVVSGCYKGKIARGEQASRLACSSFSDTKMQSKVTGEGRCWHLSVSATLVLARLGNATASLQLRCQPRRKETHPHHPSTPLPPLRDSSMTGRKSVWWLYEKRLHSQSRHHCLHLLVRRTRLEAAGRVEHPGQQIDISNCIQEQALPLQNPMHRPVDILLIF
jgi:hypothetical protein